MKNICARKGCNENENRIKGYCSVYCKDIDEAWNECDRLKQRVGELKCDISKPPTERKYCIGCSLPMDYENAENFLEEYDKALRSCVEELEQQKVLWGLVSKGLNGVDDKPYRVRFTEFHKVTDGINKAITQAKPLVDKGDEDE